MLPAQRLQLRGQVGGGGGRGRGARDMMALMSLLWPKIAELEVIASGAHMLGCLLDIDKLCILVVPQSSTSGFTV